jgi:hypothetical protein
MTEAGMNQESCIVGDVYLPLLPYSSRHGHRIQAPTLAPLWNKRPDTLDLSTVPQMSDS